VKVLGIDNVLFGVGDLNQAINFYGDALGLPIKFQVPEAGIAAFNLGEEEPGLLVRAQGSREAAAVASPRV
jgi:catechol 2,3-dioxygenase-like lactoylglutathione lyase family enzyme